MKTLPERPSGWMVAAAIVIGAGLVGFAAVGANCETEAAQSGLRVVRATVTSVVRVPKPVTMGKMGG